MSKFRLFCRFMLALAFVANGWTGGATMAPHSQHAALAVTQAAPMAMAHCHDAKAVGDTAPTQAAGHANDDCCDQGTCNCGCLHHAPIATPFFAGLEAVAFQSMPPTVRMTSVESAPVEPDIRPPIAA